MPHGSARWFASAARLSMGRPPTRNNTGTPRINVIYDKAPPPHRPAPNGTTMKRLPLPRAIKIALIIVLVLFAIPFVPRVCIYIYRNPSGPAAKPRLDGLCHRP